METTLVDLARAVARGLPFGPKVAILSAAPLSERVMRLTLQMPDGRAQPCVAKRANERERTLYRHFLTEAETGAPAYLGDADDWLFLAAVPPCPHPATPDDAARVYAHLAAIHRRFQGRAGALPGPASPWEVTPGTVAQVLSAYPGLEPHAGQAARLLTGPAQRPVQTLVQGDYHRWNILLAPDGAVRVLDWEHAAFSHPVWDLVMLDPDGPGQESVPGGAYAEAALRAYHEAGPLDGLDWPAFRRQATVARLFVAARQALAFRRQAAEAAQAAPARPGPGQPGPGPDPGPGPGPGPAEVIAQHARRAEAQVARLAAALGWAR